MVARIRTQTNTYTGYSVGCAVVWAVILVVARRRLDPEAWTTLRRVCAGWWSGWTSATIARVGYPPPKQLGPEAERRLQSVSVALIAVGLINVIRVLLRGKRTTTGSPTI